MSIRLQLRDYFNWYIIQADKSVQEDNSLPEIIEAYLDIETTGLSPEYSEITVIGIHVCKGEKTTFIQLVGAILLEGTCSKPGGRADTAHL